MRPEMLVVTLQHTVEQSRLARQAIKNHAEFLGGALEQHLPDRFARGQTECTMSAAMSKATTGSAMCRCLSVSA